MGRGESPRIVFRLLGPVEVEVAARLVPLGAPLQRAVLAVLLLHPNEVVSRERLVAALWGERPPASAAGSLQIYVHGLRRALGAWRIETHGTGYRLRVYEGEVDVARLERLVARGGRALAEGAFARAAADLTSALAIPTGPPFADLENVDGLGVDRARLGDLLVRAAELQIDAALGLGEHSDVAERLEKLIAEHPFRERFREQLMLALYRSGRQKEALEAYRAARRTLVDELGVEPAASLQALERAILRQDPALMAPEASVWRKTRLPAAPTPLFGRHLELAAVTALLMRDDVRQVTLTGTGGTGKTRLALAVAEELAPRLPDGAVFVDLSSLREARLVAVAIAESLRIEEGAESVEKAVLAELRERAALLVLDNFEQVLPAAAWVAELLREARHLLVLVTSRAPLRITWEHEYRVPPLTPPADFTDGDFEALVENDAVRLFAWRARSVDPGFELTPNSVKAVAAICRRLDGLPLAVELVGARTRDIDPVAMVEQLDRALSLPIEGEVDRPERHRTLEATLDWSFGLLNESEQRLLGCLSVFAGGWTAEAATIVCGETVTGLSSLVDHHLVEWHVDSQRFGMLETIREFARERLVADGDADAVAMRHAMFYVTLSEDAEEGFLAGLDATPLLDRLAAEHDNIRAAFGFLLAEGQPALALRLGSALAYFWRVRGHLDEGRAWLESAIATTEPVDPAIRARALSTAGRLANRQGERAHARTLHERALVEARRAGDLRAVGQALSDLGGVCLAEDDLDQAHALYTESAAALRQAEHPVRLATVLANLGSIALAKGDEAEAQRRAEEALVLQRDSGDKEGRVTTYLLLARVMIRQRRQGDARAALEQAGALIDELDYREIRGYWFLTAAEFANAHGDAHGSARFLGGADAAFERVRIRRLQAEDTRLRAHVLEAAAGALGAQGLEDALAEGGPMLDGRTSLDPS